MKQVHSMTMASKFEMGMYMGATLSIPFKPTVQTSGSNYYPAVPGLGRVCNNSLRLNGNVPVHNLKYS